MNDPAVIEGTLKGLKTLADSTIRITVDVDERHMQQAFAMYEQNMPVAIARLQAPAEPDYGQYAKKLRLSGFLRTPAVWKALGTDADYQEWCRRQKCAVCRGQDWDSEKGGGRCEYAHVRRADESGTAHKADYAGVPLCHACHRLQHDAGEAACLAPHISIHPSDTAKAWFNHKRIEHVEQWAHEALRATLGQESMKTAPPELVAQWAAEHDVANYLPSEFHVRS